MEMVFCPTCGEIFDCSATNAVSHDPVCSRCGNSYLRNPICGCGRHGIDLNKEPKVARYAGKDWRLKCLFYREDGRLPRLVEAYEKMDGRLLSFRKMIRSLMCGNCGYRCGKGWKCSHGKIICGKCQKSS